MAHAKRSVICFSCQLMIWLHYISLIYLVPKLEISVASKSAAVTTVTAQGYETFLSKTCQK